MVKLLIKSIGAGLAIVLGAIIYLNLLNWVGAVFFSIGLYLVLWFGLTLYTGKVGYIKSKRDILDIILIFIGNAIGCAAIFCIFGNAAAITIASAKLAQPLWLAAIKAIFCGILIYAGVDQYKKGKEYAPIIAVPAFILLGAEHSIADLCFFFAAGAFTPQAALFILIVAVGNAIGSLFWRAIT